LLNHPFARRGAGGFPLAEPSVCQK